MQRQDSESTEALLPELDVPEIIYRTQLNESRISRDPNLLAQKVWLLIEQDSDCFRRLSSKTSNEDINSEEGRLKTLAHHLSVEWWMDRR